jgi:hypothetical protein
MLGVLELPEAVMILRNQDTSSSGENFVTG